MTYFSPEVLIGNLLVYYPMRDDGIDGHIIDKYCISLSEHEKLRYSYLECNSNSIEHALITYKNLFYRMAGRIYKGLALDEKEIKRFNKRYSEDISSLLVETAQQLAI